MTILLIVVESQTLCLLYNKEFYSFRIPSYFVRSVNPREKNLAECVTAMEKARYLCKSSVVKPTKQRLLGKLKLRQNGNIKTDVKQMGRKSMNWIKLAWFESPNLRALVNALMFLHVPKERGFLEK